MAHGHFLFLFMLSFLSILFTMYMLLLTFPLLRMWFFVTTASNTVLEPGTWRLPSLYSSTRMTGGYGRPTRESPRGIRVLVICDIPRIN